MEFLIKNIGTGILVTGMTVASWFGVVPSDYFVPVVKEVETKVVHEYAEMPTFGASVSTPEVKALFTTSLASKITSSATSMTLVSATDKDGTTLASSTYGFVIDEGTSAEEFVLADCTGTVCTNMTRGISVSTATTSVAALKFEHRRGASVKITTAPSLVFVMNVLKGKQDIENKLRYSSTQTFNNANDIISRSYADSLSFGAVAASSETASGFVELATGVEVASSTSSGSITRLAIPASLATSTYNSATAALRVVVTQNSGKIDSNFVSTTSIGANLVLSGTSTMATSTTYFTGGIRLIEIGKNMQVFTSTASTTFTVPSGVTKLSVLMTGGGSGGQQGSANGINVGGPSAKTIFSNINVSSTSTLIIKVGAGSATSATAGGDSTVASNLTTLRAPGGGSSGTAVGDLIIGSGQGDQGTVDVTGANSACGGGSGGSSYFGGGGSGATLGGYVANCATGYSANGSAAAVYGAGGGGSAGTGTAGAGSDGVIIITW